MSDPFSFLVPRRSFALRGASLVLAACGAKPILAPKPKVLTIDVLAAANLNPSASGRPSPVVVRIYELKAAAPFESADFIMLFDKDQATLGAELVQREEMLLRPGETKKLGMTLPADAKAIAVLAAYRDLERARWREVRAVEPGKPLTLTVNFGARQIRIEAAK